MGLLKFWYKRRHPEVPEEKIPRWYKISILGDVKKIFRKWLSAVLIPSIPFNGLRVSCYRAIGYKIGKGTFIGMSYLDDLFYNRIEIGQNVTISYGVFLLVMGINKDITK